MISIFSVYFLFMYCKTKVMKKFIFSVLQSFFVARKPVMTTAKHGKPHPGLVIFLIKNGSS